MKYLSVITHLPVQTVCPCLFRATTLYTPVSSRVAGLNLRIERPASSSSIVTLFAGSIMISFLKGRQIEMIFSGHHSPEYETTHLNHWTTGLGSPTAKHARSALESSANEVACSFSRKKGVYRKASSVEI